MDTILNKQETHPGEGRPGKTARAGKIPPTSTHYYYCQTAGRVVPWYSWDDPRASVETYYCSTPGCMEMQRTTTR